MPGWTDSSKSSSESMSKSRNCAMPVMKIFNMKIFHNKGLEVPGVVIPGVSLHILV